MPKIEPRERPILFSGPMVRAVLAGRKTQTRRIIKPQPDEDGIVRELATGRWVDTSERVYRCPFGEPGDRLWVREGFCPTWSDGGGDSHECAELNGAQTIVYRADGISPFPVRRWRPSIHMPRWASRITLEVTGVRVERVQDISEEDAVAEGVCEVDGKRGVFDGGGPAMGPTAKHAFMRLWDSIYGPGAWERNDWVWAATFRRVES